MSYHSARLLALTLPSKYKAQTRVNIKKDSGLTRANTTGNPYICLFFARGCCPYGWECEYLHCLPDPNNALPDSAKDCFARDKFADYRDDMGGVGSFNRQNRTLYVGRIKETGTGLETEDIVRRHFKEFGEIERGASPALPLHLCVNLSVDDSETGWAVKVLQYRSVAFVTYKSEMHGQFAKEAMACQSLNNDEILNVRWATEDPNPTSKGVEKRRLEAMGQEVIKSKMDPSIVEAMRTVRALEDGDIIEEDEDENGPQRKRQRIEGPDAQEGYDPEDDEMAEPPPPLPQPTGLLNMDTLESLKYFADIRQKNGVQPVLPARPPPAAPLGLSLDYGSDDD